MWRRCRGSQPEDGGSIEWGKNDGMAAKGMMASDRKGTEDEDMAGGKLCGWHTPSVQKRNTVRSGKINAATPFEQGLTDSGERDITLFQPHSG